MNNFNCRDFGTKNPDGLSKTIEPIRSTAAAIMIALGLGATISEIIRKDTPSNVAKSNVAKMAQDGGGY